MRTIPFWFRTLPAALLLLGTACTGPKAPDYFRQQHDAAGPVVRVWERRLTGPLKYVATHLILEIRGPDDPHAVGQRWELFNFEDRDKPVQGHIHCSEPGPLDPDMKLSGASLAAEIRGERAVRAVAWIRANAPQYCYRGRYIACPGPNSNTFVATLIRECPDLAADLPPTAAGKDFAGWFRAGGTTTKTGVQIETPIVGAAVGLDEGLELHLLNSCLIGVDILPPAIKLAFVGRIGFPEVSAKTGRGRHSAGLAMADQAGGKDEPQRAQRQDAESAEAPPPCVTVPRPSLSEPRP